MRTISVTVQNLCAPCGCTCRYCLLQACKKGGGVDYYRGKRIAEKFVEWSKTNSALGTPGYYIGHCAEYPQLFDNIAFNRASGAPVGGRYLQCNGIKVRDQKECDAFAAQLKGAGVDMVDVTFFGDEAYHDQFAGREGDHSFMLQFAHSAVKAGIQCIPTYVITEENKGMLDELLSALRQVADISDIHGFLPDHRGRGYLLESARLTRASYEALSDAVKSTVNIGRYKTEQEWLSCGRLPEYTNREVTVNLREDNIERFERMGCEEIIEYVEKLDDAYYESIPTINELARMYGDSTNMRLYRLRDLFWKWQKRYIAENGIDIYDVTDERLCCTVRS